MARARPNLLDVNVLVALFFPSHVHHEVAHDWFHDERSQGWATCPITQNGFVRVACQQPADDVIRAGDMLRHLARFCQDRHHRFWADSVSLTDASLFAPPLITGARHLTDLYLLGLACRMGGRLATFDRSMAIDAVRGATADDVQIIAPD